MAGLGGIDFELLRGKKWLQMVCVKLHTVLPAISVLLNLAGRTTAHLDTIIIKLISRITGSNSKILFVLYSSFIEEGSTLVVISI